MQLIFANEEETSIQVTLDEGESLGHQHGPVVCFVPIDPANAEYAAILAGKFPILPKEQP